MPVDIGWSGECPLPMLRQRLALARRDGQEFDAAWPEALAHVTSRNDRRLIAQTKPAWAGAYDRTEPSAAEQATRHLHDLLEDAPSSRADVQLAA